MARLSLTGFCVLMSLAAFAAFGIDKFKAKTDRWRIPEKTLFLLALLGGGTGAWLGMRVFHHKTRHPQFRYGLPVIMAVQLALLGYLWAK